MIRTFKVCVLAISLLISVSSFAHWFPYQAQVFATPNRVQATVVNFYARPMVCQGFAFGLTTFGYQLNSYLNNVYIAPGMNAYAYVYNYNFQDPFIRGWANLNCIFVNY
jgi:hypothetical protein